MTHDSLICVSLSCCTGQTNTINKTDRQVGLKFKEEIFKGYIWSAALYDAETWTLRKLDRKYLESCEMWCWRRK